MHLDLLLHQFKAPPHRLKGLLPERELDSAKFLLPADEIEEAVDDAVVEEEEVGQEVDTRHTACEEGAAERGQVATGGKMREKVGKVLQEERRLLVAENWCRQLLRLSVRGRRDDGRADMGRTCEEVGSGEGHLSVGGGLVDKVKRRSRQHWKRRRHSNGLLSMLELQAHRWEGRARTGSAMRNTRFAARLRLLRFREEVRSEKGRPVVALRFLKRDVGAAEALLHCV